MRPSLVLLRNIHEAVQLLQGMVAVGRPPHCTRCLRVLAAVPERYGRFDAAARTWIGFLECPGCRETYVYLRTD